MDGSFQARLFRTILGSYLPLRNNLRTARMARRVVQMRLARMTPRQELGTRLLLTSEAVTGYQEMIQPGEAILKRLESNTDPDLVAEAQAEEDRIQGSIDHLDDQLGPLKTEHEQATLERDFWASEMARLDKELRGRYLTVKEFDVKQKLPVWVRGQPRVIRQERIFLEDRKQARAAIKRMKRQYLRPWQEEARQRAQDLHQRMESLLEQRSALLSEQAEWQDFYVDPGLESKEQVRYARYWRDFLDTVHTGGSHYKPLTNIPANPPLLRYRRAKLRVIFRRLPGVVHILRIARRGDDTYENLAPLIAESDRHA
jgi:hypothetical protein